MKVRFSPRARRRVKLVDRWWRDNRPATPTLFHDELETAIERLTSQPAIGAVCSTVGGVTIRCVLLPRSVQHVFYGIDEERRVIIIYTVWGATRGRGPKLP